MQLPQIPITTMVLGGCIVIVLAAFLIKWVRDRAERKAASPAKKTSKRRRVVDSKWPTPIPDQISASAPTKIVTQRSMSTREDIQRFLSDSPDGTLCISVLQVSPYGMSWLTKNLNTRPTKILVGDITMGFDTWSRTERRDAIDFISKEDVQIRMWTPPKKLMKSTDRLRLEAFKKRTWAVELVREESLEGLFQEEAAEQEEPQTEYAAISGEADLTKEDLRQNPSVLSEDEDYDHMDFETKWESAKDATDTIVDILKVVREPQIITFSQGEGHADSIVSITGDQAGGMLLDMEDMTEVTANAAVSIASLVEWYDPKNQENEITVKPPKNNSGLVSAAEMGLKEILGPSCGVDGLPQDRGDVIFPVTPIGPISEWSPTAEDMVSRGISADLAPVLKAYSDMLIHNVTAHSGVKKGFLALKRYSSTNRIELSVSDHGRGFIESCSIQGKMYSDEHIAILRLLGEGSGSLTQIQESIGKAHGAYMAIRCGPSMVMTVQSRPTDNPVVPAGITVVTIGVPLL